MAVDYWDVNTGMILNQEKTCCQEMFNCFLCSAVFIVYVCDNS